MSNRKTSTNKTFAKIIIINKVLLLFLSLVISSCANSEGKNSNPIFDTEKPESERYQTALIDKLRSTSNHLYFVDRYTLGENGDFFHVKIVGKDLCAIGIFKVSKYNAKLNDLKQSRGIGYNGAEINGFTFNTDDDELVFQDLQSIDD